MGPSGLRAVLSLMTRHLESARAIWSGMVERRIELVSSDQHDVLRNIEPTVDGRQSGGLIDAFPASPQFKQRV